MEIQVGTRTYDIGKLDVFAQLNVARKLAPAMPLLEGMVNKDNAGKDMAILELMALSQLQDDTNDYVMRSCLSVVKVKQESGYAKLTDTTGGLMFDDIKLEDLLRVVLAVIEENLGDFFRTALGKVTAGAKGQTS